MSEKQINRGEELLNRIFDEAGEKNITFEQALKNIGQRALAKRHGQQKPESKALRYQVHYYQSDAGNMLCNDHDVPKPCKTCETKIALQNGAIFTNDGRKVFGMWAGLWLHEMSREALCEIIVQQEAARRAESERHQKEIERLFDLLGRPCSRWRRLLSCLSLRPASR